MAVAVTVAGGMWQWRSERRPVVPERRGDGMFYFVGPRETFSLNPATGHDVPFCTCRGTELPLPQSLCRLKVIPFLLNLLYWLPVPCCRTVRGNSYLHRISSMTFVPLSVFLSQQKVNNEQ